MKRIPESELVINSDGSAFHLHILPEDLADIVILVGDQGRVPMVASFFDEGSIDCDKSSREFRTITGRYNGVRISAISTGIGTDNIDIVLNELDSLANINYNTREINSQLRSLTLLRIGTCGCVREDVPVGGYIFSEVSIGCDGLLNWYSEGESISDKDMEAAFMEHIGWNSRITTPYFVRAAEELSEKFGKYSDYVKGFTMSAPGFYGPQGRRLRTPLTYPDFVDKLHNFSYGGLRMSNIEMESSALAGLAALLGHRAATVCLVVANRYAKDMNTDYKGGMSEFIKKTLDVLTE